MFFFPRQVKGESNYRSYLTYVQQVGRECGFEVEEDTLRIPSTKRVSYTLICDLLHWKEYKLASSNKAKPNLHVFIDNDEKLIYKIEEYVHYKDMQILKFYVNYNDIEKKSWFLISLMFVGLCEPGNFINWLQKLLN